MLEVANIRVSYGHIEALRDVTLRVNAAEVVALVGSNGAGKSTTLRTISGLMRPTAGRITLEGKPIDALEPEKIVEEGIAHVPEGRGIFPSLSLEENLRMGAYARRRDKGVVREGIDRAVAVFPRLGERMSQPAGTLSGGEQQMLALGRALMLQPKVLMVDELSLGLAPVIVQQLFKVLRDINQAGTAVLLVEQYVTMALGIADWVVVIEKGAVSHAGPAQELAAQSDVVRSMYLGRKAKPKAKTKEGARAATR
jgi:branched-chain amino acid transport system ATP-binding protein